MILAIETSTQVCSVALAESVAVVSEKRIEGKSVHSEYTFTFIQDLLDQFGIEVSDLEAVLFSIGPGSYTGLRIGAAAIKGLLFRQHVSLFTLPTLLGFTVPFIDSLQGTVHSVIDARREHLYHQKVEKRSDGGIKISTPVVCQISDLENKIRYEDTITGTGWERLRPEVLNERNRHGTEAISAKNLLMGWHHPFIKPHFKKNDVELFEPDYLTMRQVNNTNVGLSGSNLPVNISTEKRLDNHPDKGQTDE